MATKKYRYYMNRKKVVHRRAESMFNANKELEKIYSESYTRVNGMDDLTLYEPPKAKPKTKKASKK